MSRGINSRAPFRRNFLPLLYFRCSNKFNENSARRTENYGIASELEREFRKRRRLGETRKIRRFSSKTGRVQACSVVDPESVLKWSVPEKLSRGRQPEIIILREYRARPDWHAIEMHESIRESVCRTPADTRRSRNWLRFLSSTGISFTRASFRAIARHGTYSPWFSLVRGVSKLWLALAFTVRRTWNRVHSVGCFSIFFNLYLPLGNVRSSPRENSTNFHRA